MKTAFSTFLFLLSISCFAQVQINLTGDMLLSETLEITEDTNINGNGFSLDCRDCGPALHVSNGAKVNFTDVRFLRNFNSWLKTSGVGTEVTWNSSRMRGYIRSGN